MALDFQNAGRPNGVSLPLCIALAILQVLIAPHLTLFAGRVNFMLVLVVCSAMGADSRRMPYLGFLAGLFYDLTSAAPVGFMTLLLTVSAYLLALVSRGVAPGVTLDAARLALVVSLGVNVVYAVGLFVMGFEGSPLTSIGVHGLASATLSFAACIPILALKGMGLSRAGRGNVRGMRVPGASRRYKGLQ